MTCGCKTPLLVRGELSAHPWQVREAMCWACPVTADGKRYCEDGRSCRDHVVRGDCPRGNFPDDGMIWWLGLRWYGVPLPICLWLWAFHAKHRRPRFWPGCGCIVPLRDLWDRLRLLVTAYIGAHRAHR